MTNPVDTTLNTAETLRSMLQHESEQVHRRVSWLGTFQGFLFAAVGLAWDKSNALVETISTLGLVIALLVLCGLIGVTLAVWRIRRQWGEKIPKTYEGPTLYGFFPESAPWTIFLAPENLMAVSFMIAWVWVLAIH